jgi:prolyl-tRNA synthetase
MRPRIFLRTTEFLWQEGHTAHATHEEALKETMTMLEVYRSFVEDVLAMPVIVGEKSPGERFPGAENTFTLEAMMQDRKALQSCTSHYLGQNFAKGSNIRFSNKEGQLEYAYTTSWGMTTRLIGSLIMCHGDDDGLRLPPRIAHKQIVIIPVIPKPELESQVLDYAESLAVELRKQQFYGKPLSVHIDKRDKRGGEKTWEWIKKGVPLRLEVGPRDVNDQAAMMARRDQSPKDKQSFSKDQLIQQASAILEEIQQNYYAQAVAYRDQHIYRNLETFDELRQFFTPKNEEKPEIHGGFVLAKWCGDPKSEEMLGELKVTIRCLPLKQSGTKGRCILTGKEATLDAIFAKSY